MNKKKHLFPDEFSKELSIDEAEFTAYCAYLISLFCNDKIHDDADKFSVHREDINSLGRLALMMEKARAKLYEVDTKNTQNQEYLEQIKANQNSEKTYIACGPKPTLLEQILIFGMSFFPGLSLGKMISTVVPIPILANLLGIVFGICFFWLGEKFILNAWKEVVYAPQLNPTKEKQLERGAINASVTFIFADALITGLSMVLASIPEEGTISIFSWCWLIFSIVTSIIMTFILHYCATKNRYAIRRILEQHRREGGVAIEEITAWYRDQKKEEKKLKREIKDLGKKSKILSRWIVDRERLRANLTLQIFGVEYLERADTVAFQVPSRETLTRPKLAAPGSEVPQQAVSGKNTVNSQTDNRLQNEQSSNGKVNSASSVTELKNEVQNDSEQGPDAPLF